MDFKSNLALRLVKTEDTTDDKITIGRPPKEPVPNEVRLDKVGHVIIKHSEKVRRRCKHCQSHTIYLCDKCKVHLHTDCFETFHKK